MHHFKSFRYERWWLYWKSWAFSPCCRNL